MGILLVAAAVAVELVATASDEIPWSTRNDGAVAQSWSCSPRLKCTQISSCEEANWYLQNCSWGGKLDVTATEYPARAFVENTRQQHAHAGRQARAGPPLRH